MTDVAAHDADRYQTPAAHDVSAGIGQLVHDAHSDPELSPFNISSQRNHPHTSAPNKEHAVWVGLIITHEAGTCQQQCPHGATALHAHLHRGLGHHRRPAAGVREGERDFLEGFSLLSTLQIPVRRVPWLIAKQAWEGGGTPQHGGDGGSGCCRGEDGTEDD